MTLATTYKSRKRTLATLFAPIAAALALAGAALVGSGTEAFATTSVAAPGARTDIFGIQSFVEQLQSEGVLSARTHGSIGRPQSTDFLSLRDYVEWKGCSTLAFAGRQFTSR